METHKRVYNKLAKEKTELNSQKIELSKIDDIEDFINQGLGFEEFVQEQMDIAQEAKVKARDIVRFDMNDAITEAEGLIEESQQILKELGTSSDELDRLEDQLNRLINIQEDLRKEIENL